MNLYNLSDQNSLISQYLNEIRDVKIQQDRLRFRTNLKRVSQLMGFEVSKKLNYQSQNIQTPLSTATTKILNDQIVVASIMRAGLPMHNGLLEIFDHAENAFISAYRVENQKDIKVEVEYQSSPDLNGKVLILADPMIATGNSIVKCLNHLEKYGEASQIFILGIVASQIGIERLKKSVGTNVVCYVATVDPELNDHSYIVPGLGDAGDLAYGNKL